MQHDGGCHCGTLLVRVRLTGLAEDAQVRSCGCSFCLSHGTRTVSDPAGHVDILVSETSLLQRYRFASRTADYLLCRQCGVYIGAICDTMAGSRAVINTRCLKDRAAFSQEAIHPDYDAELTEARMLRRAMNWMPATLHLPD